MMVLNDGSLGPNREVIRQEHEMNRLALIGAALAILVSAAVAMAASPSPSPTAGTTATPGASASPAASPVPSGAPPASPAPSASAQAVQGQTWFAQVQPVTVTNTATVDRPGGRALLRRPVSARALVESCVADQAALADRHAINVFASAPNTKVFVDRSRIEQAIRNLLANALRFGPSGSTVEISAQIQPSLNDQAARTLEVTVADRGPGVIRNLGAALFLPFSARADKEHSRLGLAVARQPCAPTAVASSTTTVLAVAGCSASGSRARPALRVPPE
jgi:hypothetical protein